MGVSDNRRSSNPADVLAQHKELPGSGAIIIGGDYRGLGIVRSLGRKKIPVWVLADNHLLATVSRYVSRSLRWPICGEAAQVAFLLELSAKHGLQDWLLFPTGDETTALIACHYTELQDHFRLTTPPWETMCWAHDKRLTYQLAKELEIDHPWTYCPTSYDEVAALDCTFPVILKPAIKMGFNRFVHDKAWRVDNRAQLLARYAEASTLIAPELIMIQELIPNRDNTQFSYAALCNGGEIIASVVAERTRQYPPDFGRSSSYVETVSLPELEQPARQLLAKIGLTGLVEIEFMCDPRDGRYKLLDINPRVWGWHTLGKRAGVDFCYLLWQLLHDEALPRMRGQPGIRWLRTMTDLPAVTHMIAHHKLSVREYLRSLRGPLELAIFAWEDPLPALLEAPLLFYLAWKRGAA
jgi:D-aspartate ligase